jgi:hypothetical protein
MAASLKTLCHSFPQHTGVQILRIRHLLKLFDDGYDPMFILECLDLNNAIGGYGIEPLRISRTKTVGNYINVGETYECTVIHEFKTNRLYVMSVGDFIEWRNL